VAAFGISGVELSGSAAIALLKHGDGHENPDNAFF
jgi:hypothetical protein